MSFKDDGLRDLWCDVVASALNYAASKETYNNLNNGLPTYQPQPPGPMADRAIELADLVVAARTKRDYGCECTCHN